jgi:hypothetical protein
MVKLLRRIINLFKKCKMAKINNTAAYATATPTADSIVIGSTESGGDTKNFLMSDIAAYVMTANTLTLQDVCDNGSSTTTGITVAGTTTLNGTVDINSTADISGNTTIGGTLGVTGASTLDSVAVTNNATVGGTLGVTGVSTLGEIDASGVADIADTLTLSKATGNGLSVTASADIGGNLVVSGSLSAVDIATFFQNTTFNQGVILNAAAPTSPTDTGIAGEVAVDADYIYVCTATNTWKRVALAAWTP